MLKGNQSIGPNYKLGPCTNWAHVRYTWAHVRYTNWAHVRYTNWAQLQTGTRYHWAHVQTGTREKLGQDQCRVYRRGRNEINYEIVYDGILPIYRILLVVLIGQSKPSRHRRAAHINKLIFLCHAVMPKCLNILLFYIWLEISSFQTCLPVFLTIA